jgi:hypothetical protein
MNSKYKYLKYKKKYLELKGGSGFNKYLTEAHPNNEYLTCKDHILTYLSYLKSPDNNIDFTLMSLSNEYNIKDIEDRITINFDYEKDGSSTLALIPKDENKFPFYKYYTICRFSELINKYYPENRLNKTIDSTVLNNIFINTILFKLSIYDRNHQKKILKIIDDQKFLIKYINLEQIPLIMELVRNKFYREQLNNNTLIIPEINEFNIIPDNFLTNGGLQTVIIPNGGLQTVIIPNTIIQIGERAFFNNKISTLTIPNSVIKIGERAFTDNRITRLTIGNSVTQIGDYAFAFNKITTNETPLIIPDSVTEIGEEAFVGNQITKLIIGNSVTKIGNYAFSGNKIEIIIIPDSVTEIGNSAFADNKIKEIKILDSVTKIGRFAFANNRITELTIPDFVTEISDYAFKNNNIRKLTIGNSVTKIGNYAFDTNQISELILPDSITEIGEHAFAKNQIITIESPLIIPNSVTKIGYCAFANNRITKIRITNYNTEISYKAFKDQMK